MVAKKTFCLALGCLGLVIAGARADHLVQCRPVAQLAESVRSHTRELEDALRHDYRTNRYYGQLLAHTRVISAHAARLSVLARVGVDDRGMHRAVDQMDASYQNLARTLNLADHRGHSHHGSTRVWREMRHLDQDIHAAHDHLVGIFTPHHPTHRVPDSHYPSHPGQRYPGGFTYGTPPGHPTAGFSFGTPAPSSGAGFSISNGRLTFNFGR